MSAFHDWRFVEKNTREKVSISKIISKNVWKFFILYYKDYDLSIWCIIGLLRPTYFHKYTPKLSSKVVYPGEWMMIQPQIFSFNWFWFLTCVKISLKYNIKICLWGQFDWKIFQCFVFFSIKMRALDNVPPPTRSLL